MKRDRNAETFSIDSSSYAACRPLYPEALYDFLAGQCNELLHAWDCACGTGQVASSLVDYFPKVSASDLSPQQIQDAYQHPSIDYSVQNAEHTDYAEGIFDLVCVAQALHWFDCDKFFDEVKRLLKPGGVFACWGYSFFSIEPVTDELVNRIIFEPLKPYWSERNRLLWNAYSDIRFPFKKTELPEIEMSVEWNSTELINYIKTWSAFKRYEEEHGAGIVDDFLEESGTIWLQSLRRKILMEFSLYCGRKENY